LEGIGGKELAGYLEGVEGNWRKELGGIGFGMWLGAGRG
jgi:hypothetical protein